LTGEIPASETAPRVTHAVTLATFNTLALTAHHVYHLVTPYAGAYYLNVLNLGPAAIHIRADHDPNITDQESETLHAGHADNGILVPDGREGLRILAALPGTTITVRLVRDSGAGAGFSR